MFIFGIELVEKMGRISGLNGAQQVTKVMSTTLPKRLSRSSQTFIPFVIY